MSKEDGHRVIPHLKVRQVDESHAGRPAAQVPHHNKKRVPKGAILVPVCLNCIFQHACASL
jgi:hypothetical protein